MKDWAVEHGCTHFCHWFQPLTGSTAEKHDAFLMPDGDGGAITRLKGDELIRGEPDASSFPSGGIATPSPGRARRWTRRRLLLRSMQALTEQAQRVLKLFGHTDRGAMVSSRRRSRAGVLPDRPQLLLQHARPDCICGRTLFGAAPPKGQEFDDHYFGAIPERVLAFMTEAERATCSSSAYRSRPATTRSRPASTRSRRVFENANVATDHQMLTMHVLRTVADNHGFVCLTAREAVRGRQRLGQAQQLVDLGTDTGRQPARPEGRRARRTLQFLRVLTAVIRAVDRYQPTCCAPSWRSADSGNDHRLGGERGAAGDHLDLPGRDAHRHPRPARDRAAATQTKPKGGELIDLGATNAAARFSRHSGDRNRTSPFAFTGNKFEFRAVGSSATVAWPNTVLNTIIAEVAR